MLVRKMASFHFVFRADATQVGVFPAMLSDGKTVCAVVIRARAVSKRQVI